MDDSKPNVPEAEDERTDWELVQAVCQGDESAFEIIFERHKWRVSVIAGRFFSDHVEDIVQESFTRAYFALPNFSPTREDSLASWLSKISFNTCYDELRRRERRKESRLSDLSQTEIQAIKMLAIEGPVSAEDATISRDLANKLLSHLTADDRLLLVFLDIEGFSVGEIAELMGWSTPKVKIRAFRARTHLRNILRKFL